MELCWVTSYFFSEKWCEWRVSSNWSSFVTLSLGHLSISQSLMRWFIIITLLSGRWRCCLHLQTEAQREEGYVYTWSLHSFVLGVASPSCHSSLPVLPQLFFTQERVCLHELGSTLLAPVGARSGQLACATAAALPFFVSPCMARVLSPPPSH